MGFHAPEMPIQVDDETGVWNTDALPMLYVPRHFFVNNHMGIEDEIGAERYAEILYKAGYKSAYFWCEQESECHGIYGEDIWNHYLKRLSQRGWGFFITEELDVEKGTAKVRLENSAFVYHYEKIHGKKVNRKVDYMFTGWFAGALDQILDSQKSTMRTKAVQTQSGAEEGHDVGYFQVSPL